MQDTSLRRKITNPRARHIAPKASIFIKLSLALSLLVYHRVVVRCGFAFRLPKNYVRTKNYWKGAKMSRRHFSFVTLLIAVACLSVGAYATPIAGAGAVAAHSFTSFGGRVYNSSLSGGASDQGHLTITTNNSGINIAPHQFSLRVPPPTDSQTPEPSTLILFGSGLMMVGGAVRRKFRR